MSRKFHSVNSKIFHDFGNEIASFSVSSTSGVRNGEFDCMEVGMIKSTVT